ncbi:MAG: hypothetical protein JXA10_09810 [Anaerolineae bacterium]|nr:hypothetical protein [Anaerolineae bacterium]
MNRHIMALVVIILLGISILLNLNSALAQNDPHPALLLVILLDDSSTMSGINSANTVGYSVLTGRDPSDPADGQGDGLSTGTRDEAVRSVLYLLANDTQQAHQVAIIQFSSGETTRWLGDDPDTPFFYTIGGPSFNRQTGLNAIISQLDNRPVWAGDLNPGPSDIATTLAKAEQAIKVRVSQNSGKPAILLVADDVPMEAPWSGPDKANPWKPFSPDQLVQWTSRYIPALDQTLDILRNYPAYNTTCANTINGQSQGIPVGVMALGAANWIGYDGTIAEGTPPDAYYQRMVQSLSDAPLFYTIDPNLTLDTNQLYDAFRTASTSFVRDVRCINAQDMQPTVANSQDIQYTLSVSNFDSQIHFVFDVYDPTMQVVPEITPARSNTVYTYTDAKDASASRQLSPDGVWREIWTFNHQGNWAGDWTIRFPGNTQIRSITAEKITDSTNLTLIPDRSQYAVVGAEDIQFTAELKAGDWPIYHSDPLIDHIEATVAGETFPVTFTDDDKLLIRPPTGNLPNAGRQSFAVTVYFKSDEFAPWTHEIADFFTFSEEITRGDISPNNGDTWTCTLREDSNEFGQPFTVRFVKPESISSEGVFNYIRVQVYAENPVENPAAEPIARLLWDQYTENSTAFKGVIPCEKLTPSNQQERIWIKAEFADNTPIFAAQEWAYVLAPTPTPLPTLVPTPSMLPTPTPVPPDQKNIVDETTELFDSGEPGYWLVLAIGSALGLVAVLRGAQIIRWYLMPLSYVSYTFTYQGQREAMRRALVWYLLGMPFKYSTMIPRHHMPRKNRTAEQQQPPATLEESATATPDETRSQSTHPQLRIRANPGELGLYIQAPPIGMIRLDQQLLQNQETRYVNRKKITIRIGSDYEIVIHNRRARF